MKAEIVSVGTELLMGQIANTDAQYLSKRLPELGIAVYRHVTVGDNPERIKEAVQNAISRSDLVITTGGLGPTEDDLTKEMVAEVFGLPLKLDKASLDNISGYFKGLGRSMSENNKKQAYIPQGARVMPNRRGTAPGCIIESDGKIVAVLPGPPHELTDMYEQQLEPYLKQNVDRKIESKFLRIIGIGESEVETRLLDLFHSDNPTLALYCSPGEVTARITASCPPDTDPMPLIDEVEREIRRRLGDKIYAEGLDKTMPKTVLNLLIEAGATLALAESCTGGMLAAQLVEYPGASRTLLESFVSYANEAKVHSLGVSEDTLRAHGAVSAECAREMAEGARRVSGSDYAVSITGIAGPDGWTDEKPVGTVFIGLAGDFETQVVKIHLNGDRMRIRSLSCLNALNLLRLKLVRGGADLVERQMGDNE